MDATIVSAPSSIKNKEKARDPEMHQTKKGNQWHFVRFAHSATRNHRLCRCPASPAVPGGMKVHIGVDSKSGLTHSASVTPANAHDSQELPNLLHGNETRLHGDSAYANQKEKIKEAAPKAKDFTNKRVYRNKPLSDADKETNRVSLYISDYCP